MKLTEERKVGWKHLTRKISDSEFKSLLLDIIPNKNLIFLGINFENQLK